MQKFIDENCLTLQLKEIIIYKRKERKIKNRSVQKWINIDEIDNDGIIKIKNKYIKIIQVNPINYELKSKIEKESILNSYKVFLKSCDFDFQIFIQSKKEDISVILNKLEEQKKIKENSSIKEQYENYINYLTNLNLNKKSSSKNFFIILKISEENSNYKNIKFYINEKYKKIKDALLRCGNYVYEINSKKEIIELLDLIYNPKKYIF